MAIKINPVGVEYAKELLLSGKWALNTQWKTNEPSVEAVEAYRAQHGDEALSRWFLATDADTGYRFAIGDFRKVHHSGVKAARRYGELNGVPELVDAADEVLELFDRMNAC